MKKCQIESYIVNGNMKETEVNDVEAKINGGLYVVKKIHKKSDVWKSFSLVVDAYDGSVRDYARCDKCLAIYKYRPHETGTTSFKRHSIKCQGIKVADQRKFKKMKISYKDVDDDSDSELTEKDLILEKIRNHEYKKVTVTDKKSAVWNNYYEVRDQNDEFMSYLMCKSCDKLFFFRLNRTGTTSLKRHTAICRRMFTGIKKEGREKNMRRRVYRVIPSDAKEKVINACLSLCASDILPYDMILNEGLLGYSQVLINIGAAKGFLNVNSVIPEEEQLYNQTREKAANIFPQIIDFIMRILSNGQHVAISHDVWCDAENRSFIGVNCHFINDWEIQTLSLGCIHLLGKKDELDVHAEIIKFLRTLGFTESDILTKFTFVNSKNNGERKSNIQPCMLEIINSTLYYTFCDFSDKRNEYGESYYEPHDQEFAGEMQALLQSCYELETFLKSNSIVYEHESDRNWNANFSMISNLAKSEQRIRDQLEKIGQSKILNRVDFETINIINNFLKPFKVVIDTLSRNDVCTIYGVLLLKLKLDNHLELKFNDSALLQKLKVRAEVVHKEKYIILPHHRVATLLCPKFKNLHFLKENEKQDTLKLVQQHMSRYRNVVFEPIVKISEVNSCTNIGSRSLIDFDEFSENAEGINREPNKELENYLQTNFMFEKSEKHIGGIDVLNFWKEKEQTFPCLSRLAKSVLCVPSCGSFNETLFGTQNFTYNMSANNYIMESLNSLLILSKSSCIQKSN